MSQEQSQINSQVGQNLQQVRQQILDATDKANRQANSVTLLAVSKTKPVEAIMAAIEAGQTQFGENYVQEGVEKVQYFQQQLLPAPLCWHFIGPIQSNKTKPIAEHFDWVHSIDRLKIATRLSQQRPENLAPLQVLIQVNTSGEASKSGVMPHEVAQLCQQVNQLEQLELRGLMSIPAPTQDPTQQRQAFEELAQLFTQLQSDYPRFDTLSMGMSGDMQAAIDSGSTMVRIGTAIFGARDYSK
ncbi:MAG: YggS family pyridoxal phosphate-dependent enzyme [Vibrio sp.]